MHIILWVLFIVVVCALILYIKYVKVHVYTLFIAYYKILMRQGWRTEDAIKAAIDNFRHRKPFSLLSDSDLNNVMEVLKNLYNPAEVGAVLLQKIELANRDIKRINNKDDMFEWAVCEDIKITLINIIETARKLSPQNIKFNIAERIIILLMKRVGWKRSPDNQSNFVFDYHGKRILIDKQNNALNIVRSVISIELNEKFESNRASYNFGDNYDRLFNKSWQEFSDKKGKLI